MSQPFEIPYIRPLDHAQCQRFRKYWDGLVHPTGSLGQLEEIGIKLSAIYGEIPERLGPKLTIVMCSDNGILEENISSSSKVLTKQLALEMVEGVTGLVAMSQVAGSDYWVVDLGIEDFSGHPQIISRRINNGSKNFMKEDAMSQSEAYQALEIGIQVANQAVKEGYQVLGTGELGMGNTTTSACVIAGLTGVSADEVVGLGSGVNEEQLINKKKAVEKGLSLRQADPRDPLGLAAKVGGFDIVALAGVFLAGASQGIPLVIDGLISAAAALLAYRLNPHVRGYVFASHLAKEKGSQLALEAMDLDVGYLDLEMRLGEGAACPLMFQLMEASIHCMNSMSKFSETSIKNDLVNIRPKGQKEQRGQES